MLLYFVVPAVAVTVLLVVLVPVVVVVVVVAVAVVKCSCGCCCCCCFELILVCSEYVTEIFSPRSHFHLQHATSSTKKGGRGREKGYRRFKFLFLPQVDPMCEFQQKHSGQAAVRLFLFPARSETSETTGEASNIKSGAYSLSPLAIEKLPGPWCQRPKSFVCIITSGVLFHFVICPAAVTIGNVNLTPAVNTCPH